MEAWLKKLGLGAVNPGVFDGTWRGGAVVASVSPDLNQQTVWRTV